MTLLFCYIKTPHTHTKKKKEVVFYFRVFDTS